MSSISVNTITDASGGTTATINGYTPTMSNMAGRNRIINGDMRIDQRNAGASYTIPNTAIQYVLDRWYSRFFSGSGHTVQQVEDAPSGFLYSQKITIGTGEAVSGTDYNRAVQVIEGSNCTDLNYGTANAKTVTVSFWVKSSVTGTFGVCVKGGGTRVYIESYTINSANTWEYKTFTAIGDTNTALNSNTNGEGLFIAFDLGEGPDRSQLSTGDWQTPSVTSFGLTNGVKLVETSGATWQITGVQLEAGSVATPFEHRPYGQELALCQRYYWAMTQTVYACVYAASNCMGHIWFPTTMRADPTVVSVLLSSGTLNSEYINPHYYGWYITGDTTTSCSDIKATAEL